MNFIHFETRKQNRAKAPELLHYSYPIELSNLSYMQAFAFFTCQHDLLELNESL